MNRKEIGTYSWRWNRTAAADAGPKAWTSSTAVLTPPREGTYKFPFSFYWPTHESLKSLLCELASNKKNKEN